MKKSELKTGMITQNGHGELMQVLKNNWYNEDILLSKTGLCTLLSSFNEDLELGGRVRVRSPYTIGFDIIRVYKPKVLNGFMVADKDFMDLIWEK